MDLLAYNEMDISKVLDYWTVREELEQEAEQVIDCWLKGFWRWLDVIVALS